MLDRQTLIAYSRQPSVADFIQRILADAGYEAVACWSTIEDLERAISECDPAAVVYEVGFPLESELKVFDDFRRRPGLVAIPFVIATPAPADLCDRLGVPDALDVFTKPTKGDVDAALQSAVAARRESRVPSDHAVS